MTGPFIPIEDLDDPGRRRFLHLMAASLALAGSACSGPPQEEIRPYVRMPEAVLPGQPTFYASTLVRRGYGLGVLVESNMGRPTKVEGNPAHPASRGGTDVFAQAEVLQFWDPDRSQTPWHGGQIATWEAVRSFLADRGAALRRNGGAGLRVLTGAMTSPTWAAQWQALLREFPAARWHGWEPLHDDGAFLAAGLAWNRPVDTVLHLDKARVVASFGADFLGQGGEPGAVAYARDFAALRRQPERPSRLYAVDIAASLTGANADQRISLAPAEADRLVWRLAAALGVGTGFAPNARTARWEATLAKELDAHRGEGLLVAGPFLQPETRVLVHLLNHRLGNAGRTVDYLPPAELAPGSHGDSLAALVKDMEAGRVDTLLILGCNPVYASPAGLGFAEALGRVAHSIHAGLTRDETGFACAWHLPLAHDFEHWSDARAYEGSISVVQPVIRSLYGARSAREILAMLGSGAPASDYDAVRRSLAQLIPGGKADFEAGWNRVLAEGVIAGSAPAPLRLPPPRLPPLPKLEEPALTAVFLPDSSVGDGHYANNAWLQELPRPLTTLTWDNAALLAPATARALGLENGQVVELAAAGKALRAPVWIQPGQAEGTVGIPLGYGRQAAGRVGNGVGYDGYRLLGTGPTAAVSLTATSERHAFACRQPVASQEGRELVKLVAAAPYGQERCSLEDAPKESLYPGFSYPGYAWAMAIDLNACIGCGACTIACQAENNIPVVGREEVAKGREMHWIRVDRYLDEAGKGGPVLFQPVPCMHCENAPCEAVCPVGATMHDSEGLNVQVYNRCVGTRYCSNNCPYKVRRFNFLQYSNTDVESLKAGMNPEVTVRRRGVMEKCNYCLQRITRARIAAEERGRPIADGEVVTACEAVCPTRAIVFGDLNIPDSRVNRARASPLNYALLAELNTRPRTTYIARVTNPDPDLAGS